MRILPGRALAFGLAAVTLVVAAASPVSAHSTANASAQISSAVASVPDGVEAQVNSDGSQITVRATAGEVIVLGYDGEPFLRLSPGEVDSNDSSPTASDVSDPLTSVPPAEAAGSSVRWRKVAPGGWYPWSDHRISWTGEALPQEVHDHPDADHPLGTWSIPVTVDGHAAAITGTLTWTATDGSQTLTIAGCVGFVLLVLAGATWLARPARGPRRARS
jgi:hypothetical protein